MTTAAKVINQVRIIPFPAELTEDQVDVFNERIYGCGYEAMLVTIFGCIVGVWYDESVDKFIHEIYEEVISE